MLGCFDVSTNEKSEKKNGEKRISPEENTHNETVFCFLDILPACLVYAIATFYYGVLRLGLVRKLISACSASHLV